MLIRRVVAGDRAAAEMLIRAHQAGLYAYLLRLARRPEIAEDITQEAFVRALTHIARYDPRFRFSTWLFTIAKRLYVNAQQRLAPVYDCDIVGSAGARNAGDGAAGAVAARQESERVVSDAISHAIEDLSEDQREVVVLFYQLGWAVEQIGEYLNQPEGTVKSHLHRARKKLRAALASHPALAEATRVTVRAARPAEGRALPQ